MDEFPRSHPDRLDPRLKTFDHVVVLMLENRSFDNLLGFLYPDGVPKDAPAGKKFRGVSRDMSNPVPPDFKHQPPDGSGRVYVSGASSYHQPYPDPGEEFEHVTRQLFDDPLGTRSEHPQMQGFVADYIEKLEEKVSHTCGKPTYRKYSQIIQCFEPAKVPVLSTLAREFGVFDHWFCGVPSQTWCNRAFWHAGTSWGRVNNEPYEEWFKYNGTDTIFNQISRSKSHLDWKVYHGTPFVSLTNIIHFGALVGHESRFHGLKHFFDDCESGELPAYSFLEPDFMVEHNDYHPSSTGLGLIDYWTWPGAVMLGERLVAKVYEAIRKSTGRKDGTGSSSQNTLLVITFDEHGGCFDHVSPPPHVEPPELEGYPLQDGFTFNRPGVRIPTIMVSAHIAPHTVINETMFHTSFMNTMQAKWGAEVGKEHFGQLSKRQNSANRFTDVFTASEARPAEEWPTVRPPRFPCLFERKRSNHALDDLERSIVSGTEKMLQQNGITHEASGVETRDDALAYLAQARVRLDAAS